MPTATLRKAVRRRKIARKAVPVRRAKGTVFALSEAELARINGAQESLVPMS